MNSDIKTLADTIIYIARERIKEGLPYQNENAAIYAVQLNVQCEVMKTMKVNGK